MKRLTKSQYEELAGVLNLVGAANPNEISQATIKMVATTLAKFYAQSDTQFDRAKFLKQCGITD